MPRIRKTYYVYFMYSVIKYNNFVPKEISIPELSSFKTRYFHIFFILSSGCHLVCQVHTLYTHVSVIFMSNYTRYKPVKNQYYELVMEQNSSCPVKKLQQTALSHLSKNCNRTRHVTSSMHFNYCCEKRHFQTCGMPFTTTDYT